MEGRVVLPSRWVRALHSSHGAIGWLGEACEREFGVDAAAKAILVDRELSGLTAHL
jgi:hypothetical protein